MTEDVKNNESKPKMMENQRRTISPYDLTSNDNPGSVISRPLLKGDNYEEWAINLETALYSRNKFGFLDGSIKPPTEGSPDYDDWKPINALIVSWIKMTIEPKLLSNISHKPLARDLWEHIRKRFRVTNGPRVQQLRKELANCQQAGMSIEAYYGKLTKIWDCLGCYRPPLSCTCGLCTCNFSAEDEKRREEDKVHDFVMGLDEEVYGMVKSNLLSQEPLPTLEYVYLKVTQDEDARLKKKTPEEKPENMAFVAQTQKPKYRDDRDVGIVCSNCGRTGHRSETCFQIVGFPEWWGDRPRNRMGRGRGFGPPTGLTRGRGGTARVNVARVVGQPNIGVANVAVTDADRTAVCGLTDEQWLSVKRVMNAAAIGADEQTSGKSLSPSWIIDSGATHHLTCKKEILNLRASTPTQIMLADGRVVVGNTVGTVVLNSHLRLIEVFYIENLGFDLISVSQLMEENNCVVQMSVPFCVLQDRITRMLIGIGRPVGGLIYFQNVEIVAAAKGHTSQSVELWHRRLGHPSLKVVQKLSGFGFSSNSSDLMNKACETCIRAKQTRCSFPLSNNKTSEIFEMVHCDVWGPYRTPSFSGARYFLTVVDDFSRGTWIYLMNAKSETSTKLRYFLALVKRQFGKQVRTIRSDNGSEFMALTSYFLEEGIHHETSCVGTPQQNGRVERKHRHLLNVARAVMFEGHLPVEFWGECALTAAYLINRTPSLVLNGKTPYEVLYGKQPSYDHLRVIGCVCYIHNQDHKGDKFVSRSRKCVFVGYPHGKKGWRVFDLEKEVFTVSRDVVFREDTFHFLSSQRNITEDPFADKVHTVPVFNEDQEGIVGADPMIVTNENESSVSDKVEESPQVIVVSSESDTDQGSTDDIEEDNVIEQHVNDISGQEHISAPLRVGERERKRPGYLKDYDTSFVCVDSDKPYPISAVVSCSRFSENHKVFLAAITTVHEPRSFVEAMTDDSWRNAVGSEIGSLELNKTWTLEDLPKDKKAIGCQWVFRIKHRSDGTIERYKARLVVLGNRQVAGVDYGETFAPVVKMTTVRSFLAVVAARNWEVHQMDVHNAFLHGDLEEEVYMTLPPGFPSRHDGKVCRLRKSLYGLKQAPRCWFAKLASSLEKYSFAQSFGDYSLFVYKKNEVEIRVLVYVDDLVITGNTIGAIENFKKYLSTCFYMKDLGVLKYFLGIEVSRSPKGIYLSQRKYVLDLLAETGLLDSKPVLFPLEQHHRLGLAVGPFLSNPEPYRRLVGKLIYLGVTRSDLAYSVHILSQFMGAPRKDHWEAAIRVLRYLKSSPGQGILLRADCDLQIYGWCDSDYAGCTLSRRSTTGWFILLGQSPISWKTKKQDVVSQSSAEAEYRAMALTTKELKWLKNLLEDLGVVLTQPMRLYCDNKAALHISANPVFHERTKHIEKDCHFIRDEIKSGKIVTAHVSTKLQLADIFTKALGEREFDVFRDKLGILDLHAPA